MKKGIPFRKAHGIVGALVTQCEKQGKSLGQLSLAEFQECSSAIDADVYDSLGAVNVVRRYISAGAAGPEQAQQQLTFWQKHLAEQKKVVRPRTTLLRRAGTLALRGAGTTHERG